ncbi:MAG: hypothetical protein CR967_02790 [Proteobacteria bacterium]|nr:MAG: hypothetical protein CR967_02790 [Pseudomonadota bacterium]
MKKLINFLINLILILIILAIFIWLGMTFFKAYKPKPYQLQGQIEAQSYSISSKVAGRIEKVFVKKGDRVKKGDLIFSINSPELQAKIDQAKASKDAAKALAQQAKSGARKQQISAAYDNYKKAKVASNLAKKTYERVNNLYKDGVVSKQTKDEAYTKYQASIYTKEAALQMYNLAREGTREETKLAALNKEKAAASVVAEVEAIASDLNIKSFYDGEVNNVLLQSGELAPTGFPVVQITDMNDAWLVLHVREDELEKFKKGSTFKGKIPALGNKSFTFKVSFISVMGDFATWRATDARKGFDMKTFEIEARAVEPIKDLRVGMSVLVEK